jgi:hypothetical protein
MKRIKRTLLLPSLLTLGEAVVAALRGLKRIDNQDAYLGRNRELSLQLHKIYCCR